MTAETPIDNFEETLDEDNSEEIGSEADDAYGEEKHLVDHAEPEPETEAEDNGDSFWGGNPEELSPELKSAYKGMQSAFTKRMQ